LLHAALANDGSSRFLGQAPRQTTPEVALMKSRTNASMLRDAQRPSWLGLNISPAN
jgi:hypothetical protein